MPPFTTTPSAYAFVLLNHISQTSGLTIHSTHKHAGYPSINTRISVPLEGAYPTQSSAFVSLLTTTSHQQAPQSLHNCPPRKQTIQLLISSNHTQHHQTRFSFITLPQKNPRGHIPTTAITNVLATRCVQAQLKPDPPLGLISST